MIQEKLKLDGHYHISSHDDIGTSLQVSISLFFFEKYLSADMCCMNIYLTLMILTL